MMASNSIPSSRISKCKEEIQLGQEINELYDKINSLLRKLRDSTDYHSEEKVERQDVRISVTGQRADEETMNN